MSDTNLHHFLLVAQLPRAERLTLAVRCAGVSVRLLSSMSLPTRLKDAVALEEVLRLAEESAHRSDDLSDLKAGMQKLRHLAFTAPAQCKYQSETFVCHVARAAYAAAQTALTGSSVATQDALESAFAAARTAESRPAEESLWQELRRARRAGMLAVGSKMMTGVDAAPTGPTPVLPGRDIE